MSITLLPTRSLVLRKNNKQENMNQTNIHNACMIGIYTGLGIAVAPAALTALAASSKIILVNIIVGIAVRILTLGKFGASMHGVGFIEVPIIFWKISLVSAIAGGSVLAISLIALATLNIYQKIVLKKEKGLLRG